MINQQISDMMRRDAHFRERMEELGYSNKPIVAVIDWGAETIFTQQTNYTFNNVSSDYLDLFRSTMTQAFKRTPLTEDAVALADELVESAPEIPHKKAPTRMSRDLFHNMFMYEMLLLNELEEHLELSEDNTIHLVDQYALTQGVDHMKKQILKEQPKRSEMELTL